MTLLLFQKKPLFDRGNPRETWFWPLFRPPPENPQKSPKLPFLATFWTPKNPQNPQKPPKWPKFQKMALFDQICLFGQKLWRFDKQNPPFWPPLGDSPPPPKMALFDPPRENPQKPPILAIFGHFLVKIWGCEWILAPPGQTSYI